MSNITVTNIDTGNVILKDCEFTDELLTFAASGTVAAGTILARDSGSLKLVPFVKGGATDDNGVPKAVLSYDVEADAAGDVAIRAISAGVVRSNRLIIDADGDGSNIDAAVLDGLRDYSIVAVEVTELNHLDNQ